MTEKTEATLQMEEFVSPAVLKHPVLLQHSPLNVSCKQWCVKIKPPPSGKPSLYLCSQPKESLQEIKGKK